jgi:hypothetical protein
MSIVFVPYIMYYITIATNKQKADRQSYQLYPIGTNQKKGSSIISGAKEKDNEEN